MFNYNTNLLPNARLAELEHGVSNIDEAIDRSGLTIGYPGWGLLYHLLLCHLNRDRTEIVLETGTNQGCTSIAIAQALADCGGGGMLHTHELEPENARKAQENLRSADLEHLVNVHVGSTRDTLPLVVEGIRECRFAFLDASHLYEDVLFEFETVLPVLSEDALVVFDNTYQIAEDGEDPRVNGALKTIVEAYGGNLINLEFVSWFTPGLALWQKRPNLGGND